MGRAGGSPDASPDPGIGERLGACEARLRLVLAHLAGGAVRARVEVDDLVQEVWLRALSAGSLPAPSPDEAALQRWLARLARNAVVDAARAIRARSGRGPDLRLAHGDWSRFGPRASSLAAPTAGPATRAVRREEAARVEAAFLRLSPEHRRVIGLRELEGLSAREAGRRMGRSEAAVHSLFRRALAAWDEGARERRGTRDESGRGARPGRA